MKSNFIKKQIDKYKKLDKCFCLSLQEDVFFNADGLHHILYYRRRPRKYSEKYYRASLITHIIEVIENAKLAIKRIESENPLVVTWSLEHKITNVDFEQVVKVILRKKGNGRIYFLSVMSNKTKKKTKKSKP